MNIPDGQYCGSCRYHTGYDPQENLLGRCTRYPPVPAADNEEGLSPRTDEADWCGEYAPDNPQTATEAAVTLARLVLLGDLTAARALADKLRE